MATVIKKIAGSGVDLNLVATVSNVASTNLMKTGQTTDRTPTGRTSVDDGGAGVGVGRSYRLLTAGQYSGTTTVTVNAIDDAHTNNCVVDNITGLMWNKQNTPNIYGAGTEGLLFDDTGGSNEDIFNYVDAANTAGLSGYSDWRVPNIFEMYSILNYEAASAVPDSAFFTAATTLQYLSSTSRPPATTNGVAVSIINGFSQSAAKTTSRGLMMLVRG